MVKQRKSRGPTPKAEERVWHKRRVEKTAKLKQKTSRNKSGITSSQNRIKNTSKSLDNIIYGQNPVYEYLKSHTPAQKLIISSSITPSENLQNIISLANSSNIKIFELPKSQIDSITNERVAHQGVVLYCEKYQYTDIHDLISERKNIVILDHITDPHNLGAVIRSCAAFNANIIIPNARSVEVNATVWKTSAGNATKTKIAKVSNLNNAIESLKKSNYFIIGLDGSGTININDTFILDEKLVCFVAGNEGSGISSLISKNCDVLAKIPVAVESLNVATAVSISLFAKSCN